MTILSTGSFSTSPFAGLTKFTPFILYGEIVQSDIVPFGGSTRWERIRALEKVSNIVEMELNRHQLDIAYPVHFTNQFGNEPARVTIKGNWGIIDATAGTHPPAKLADDVVRINANVSVEGQGSFNAADFKPSEEIDLLATEIKTWFENNFEDYISVMALDVHGVLYGRRGRHFPNS